MSVGWKDMVMCLAYYTEAVFSPLPFKIQACVTGIHDCQLKNSSFFVALGPETALVFVAWFEQGILRHIIHEQCVKGAI
jgi:hypothetical protein